MTQPDTGVGPNGYRLTTHDIDREEKRDFTVVYVNDSEATISCRPTWLQERLRSEERFLPIAGEAGETMINLDNVLVITPYVELGF